MSTVFVAQSESLRSWATDVGLTKHVYYLGVVVEDGEAAVAAMNACRAGGRDDWKLIRQRTVADVDEADARETLARKETRIDPKYYPQLRGSPGIFKVKTANVENQMMVQRALAGELTKALRLKATDIADYLIRNAVG
ncbi:MAG: hypothetical protein MUE49_12145 [Rhodospirillales bacterium]|jgi:hypothetical protein|nr:hypothetical protein [Rhodospirillales bacterium]